TCALPISRAQIEEIMLYLEIINAGVLFCDLSQQLPQLRDIPLPVPEFVNQIALSVLFGDLELAIKRAVCDRYSQIVIQNQNGLSRALDKRVSVMTALLQRTLQRVDVQEADHSYLNLSFRGVVRKDSHQVPGTVLFPY